MICFIIGDVLKMECSYKQGIIDLYSDNGKVEIDYKS